MRHRGQDVILIAMTRGMTLIKILAVGAVFLFFFFNYFYYVDVAGGCRIFLEPGLLEWNNVTLKEAIKTMKVSLPDEYKELCINVRHISPTISCGGFGGGCFHPVERDTKTIYVSTAQRDFIWTIGVIVHEACHARQNRETGVLNEGECYAADDAAIRKIIFYPTLP